MREQTVGPGVLAQKGYTHNTLQGALTALAAMVVWTGGMGQTLGPSLSVFIGILWVLEVL